MATIWSTMAATSRGLAPLSCESVNRLKFTHISQLYSRWSDRNSDCWFVHRESGRSSGCRPQPSRRERDWIHHFGLKNDSIAVNAELQKYQERGSRRPAPYSSNIAR
jgi:hypothetical protein